jgi:hypothetical protein
MTKEMEDNFLQLSAVEFEMFQELLHFMAGKSPAEIGLRIRTSPGMQVTAKSKMYHSEVCDIDYEGFCVQTTFVHKDDKKALETNKLAVEKLIQITGGPSGWLKNTGFYLKKDVDQNTVISFITDYLFHKKNQKIEPQIIKSYIRKQNDLGHCNFWNIAIKTKVNDLLTDDGITISGLNINRLQFSRHDAYENDNFAYLKAIKSSNDIFADADNPQEVGRKCTNDMQRFAERGKYDNGRGLIVVYPIRSDSKPYLNSKNRLPLDAKDDVYGLAIFFPADQTNRGGQGGVRVIITPNSTANEEEDFENEPTI